MESFIIRIYRRTEPETIVGTVERVGTKKRWKSFHNMRELAAILSSTFPRLRRPPGDRKV